MSKEHKIGEKFQYLTETLEVCETTFCEGCFFDNYDFCGGSIEEATGQCSSLFRSDKKSVIFKLVKK